MLSAAGAGEAAGVVVAVVAGFESVISPSSGAGRLRDVEGDVGVVEPCVWDNVAFTAKSSVSLFYLTLTPA